MRARSWGAVLLLVGIVGCAEPSSPTPERTTNASADDAEFDPCTLLSASQLEVLAGRVVDVRSPPNPRTCQVSDKPVGVASAPVTYSAERSTTWAVEIAELTEFVPAGERAPQRLAAALKAVGKTEADLARMDSATACAVYYRFSAGGPRRPGDSEALVASEHGNAQATMCIDGVVSEIALANAGASLAEERLEVALRQLHAAAIARLPRAT